MQTNVETKGYLSLELLDENLNRISYSETNNLIVTGGKNFFASRIIGTSSATMSAMAIGSGTIPALVGDTTLQTELIRVSGSYFVASVGVTANIAKYTATFSPGVGTGTLSEAGILNSTTTGGTMLAHTVFSPITKLSTNTLVIVWNVVFV